MDIRDYIKYDTESAYPRVCWPKENPYPKKLYKLEPGCLDTDTAMTSIMHQIQIQTKITENQDHVIMSTIQTIGGTTYQEITVDKKQVLDMLKKAKATKVRTGEHNFYADDKKRTDHHYYCPNCMKQLRTVKTVDGFKYPVDISGPMVKFCPDCGQKLDWEEEEKPRDVYYYHGPMTKTKARAEEVLDMMDGIIEEYGFVTVADAKEFAGCKASYEDDKYGWTSIGGAEIVKEKGGYYRVKMPKAKPVW